MKAILEFNLNEPEDAVAHMRCVKSLAMASALFDIKINLVKRLEELQELDSSGALDLLEILGQELEVVFDHYGLTEELLN